MIDQLALFGPEGEDMSDDERAAIIRDFLGRYSDDARTNGALRARPCVCLPDGLGHFDADAFESRCVKCGRTPSVSTL